MLLMRPRKHDIRNSNACVMSNCTETCKIPRTFATALVTLLLLTARPFLPAVAIFFATSPALCHAAELVQTIARIKSSVVGVGTFIKTRSPSFQLGGTGFIVADGLHVITNAHNYAKPLDSEKLKCRWC